MKHLRNIIISFFIAMVTAFLFIGCRSALFAGRDGRGVASVGGDGAGETLVVHDTVYLPLEMLVSKWTELHDTVDEWSRDEADSWLSVDGQQLVVRGAISLRGTGIRVFDEKGHLVVDTFIPCSQMTDTFRVPLPENSRYYLRLNNGNTYLLDLPAQKVKK